MAQWVSHLIVADRVLHLLPQLSRREYCVGNIAPDCNIPNDDWSEFTPSRAVTHWIKGSRKTESDSIDFYNEYILTRINTINSKEELSFLLGYYSHLITDAEFQRTVRDEERVAAVWKRVKTIPALLKKAEGMEETWDSFKKLCPDRMDRERDFFVIEREYLDKNPDSGYLTEIRELESFPDYIDYLPKGAIPLKIKMMYYMPALKKGQYPFVAFSRDEYEGFLERAIDKSYKSIRSLVKERLSD